ncbi:glycoside hydrolase family 25 protein [Weizmannia sp. CD-2023]|uniref:glycoside hydrolase family 25 protein n=1 Tax=Heyndrickxia TaxID=2837504 RepID=UPI0005521076|nr:MULTISPECIES: glycoside hydrolase family 25 protein [Heyndrickxia]KGT37759.1 glycoside hydrolase [Heyndrickxia coagulans P38]MED4321485.1 glycoside hydrolase family 25 protein [Weizmannia sp. CD-2023]MED4975098.1 glycoside hydrolase family 25 protein [Weizmannia sp. CD-2023]
MRRLIFLGGAGFLLLFALSFVKPASAASSTMYTWTPSKLYKTASGAAYSRNVNSGTAVTVYSKSGKRYKVKAGGKTGYIYADNLTRSKVKKEDYFGSKIYKQAAGGPYVASVPAGKMMYIKMEATKNGMYLAHVIGTGYSGYVDKTHFIKPVVKYTWMPSKLYTSATGNSYNKTIKDGQKVSVFNGSHGRYQVKAGNSSGYIYANNLTGLLAKKTVYASSKLYTSASHTKYTAVIRPNQQVYVKESTQNMSHICVVGTTQSGWIYTSHFTKPAPAAGGTTSTTTGTSQTGSSTAGGKTTGTATGSTSGSTGSAAATSGTTTTGNTGSGSASGTAATGNTGSGSASGTTTTGSTGSATASATTTKGLDVSHYQTLTQDSFNLMKSQGYNFVILKATEGSGYTDSKFYTYYKYARNAGLSVHAYHMIGNSTTTSAQHIAEAKHFYQVLAQTKAKTGYAFTGYAFEDIEPTGTNSITTTWWANAAPACAGYFLNEMQTLGQTKVGIYAGYFNWKSYLEGHTDSWPSNTKIWLARYNITLGTNADVWQYTETGTIDGITGHFDLDISYDPDF